MNIVYFSSLNWDEAGGAHNPTQVSLALAKRGHSILFIEPHPSRTREAGGLPISVVALTEMGMTHARVKRAWYGLDAGDLGPVSAEIGAHLTALPASDACFAIYSAPFEPYVRLLPLLQSRGYAPVYYSMDDFAAAPALGYTQFSAAADEYLTRHAAVLIAVTRAGADKLGERAGAPGSGRVVPCGINAAEFLNGGNGAPKSKWRREEKPPIRGERTLGFWGTLIDSMVDAELLAYVAKERPQWAIHLLGAIDPEMGRPSIAARLRGLPNVYLHGPVPHATLPRYAFAFDVCLVPLPDNDFSRARDPLKVYEYLAAHKPVATANAPHLASMPFVYNANSPQKFVEQIEAAARIPFDSKTVDAFLAEQSWDARGAALEQILGEAPHNDSLSGGSAMPLPSFIHDDAVSLSHYADVLQVELTQTQVWALELERSLVARNREVERLRRLLPSRLWRRRRASETLSHGTMGKKD